MHPCPEIRLTAQETLPGTSFFQLLKKTGWTSHETKKALKHAGITDYRWHDNRHTWASILIQNGVPLNEVQERGARNNAEMVKRYAHLAPQKLASNAQIVDQILSKTVTILSQ